MMDDDRKKRISVNQISKPINDQDINEEIEKYQKLIKNNTDQTKTIKKKSEGILYNDSSDYNYTEFNNITEEIDENIKKHEKLIDGIKENNIIPKNIEKKYIDQSNIAFRNDPKEVLIKKIQNDLAKLSDIKKHLDQTFLESKNITIPEIKNDIIYSTSQESSSLIKRAVGGKASFLKDLGNLLKDLSKKVDIFYERVQLNQPIYKLKAVHSIFNTFKKKQPISGKQLKDAITELKNSDTFKEVDAKGKPTANAKLVQKLVHQLELMPTNAVVQAAKIEKSKTNILNRIFKRGDYKVAKESKNDITKELNYVETARQYFLKEKTDIERKIKDIDKKLLTLEEKTNFKDEKGNAKSDLFTKQLKQNLEVEKNTLNTQLDTLKETFKKTVSYKEYAILNSKEEQKRIKHLTDDVSKLKEKINKVEKEITKLENNRLKSKSPATQSQQNKIKAINATLINLDDRLKNTLQQKYTLMNQTLEAPKNATKTTIIDPSINKPAKPLSTSKAVRSFSITSATQINEKNLDYGNKFKSFNQLLKTDINNPGAVFDKALSSSKNDPKLFEKKMNDEIDKEVKERIKFESDPLKDEVKQEKATLEKAWKEIKKPTKDEKENYKKDLKILELFEKRAKNNIEGIKEKYNTLGKEAKTEVKAFAKEMKEVSKGMVR